MQDTNIEPVLEAILVNQNEGMDEMNKNLEAIIVQNEENKLEPILENMIIQNDESQKILTDINNSIKEKKVTPKIEIEVDGATIEVIEGPKGDKGDTGAEPTDERLISLIEPLIPTPKDGVDGKDGVSVDKAEVVSNVLDIVLSEIPTVEEIVSQIPIPQNGLDGKDANENEIIKTVLEIIPKPKNGTNGKDGSPDTGKQIVTKLKTLKKGERLSYEDLDDTPTYFQGASKTVSLVELDDVNLTGLTKTNGKYDLGSGGGSGAVDSVNGQTGVVVLTTNDVAEVSDKKYLTNAEETKLGHITVTQAVNLDTIESDTATNNAKVTNATHTGDVTGATALTIATAVVTNAKLANMATKTYKGRTTAGTGVPEDVSVATLKTDLSLVKADVGLGNVDNTSDANKPVSTAQQTALNLKANLASPALTGNPTLQGGILSIGGDGTNTGAIQLLPANGAYNFYSWVNKEVGGSEGIALQRGAYPSVISTPLTISAAGSAVFANNITAGGLVATGSGTFTSTSAAMLSLGASGVYYNMGVSSSVPATIAVDYNFVRSTIGNATITKAASGTHPLVASSSIKPMTIAGSGSTITNTATQYIEGAMTGGTNNYALWVDDGTVRIDGDIENKTQTLTDNSTKVASTAFVQGNKVGYVLSTYSTSGFAAVDSTSFYFAHQITSGGTVVDGMVIPKSGTIKAIVAKLKVKGTLGSSENSTIYIRVNSTDTVLSSTLKWDVASQTLSYTGLNISVSAGDDIQIKIDTPAWVTNPTTNQFASAIYIE